MVQPNAYLKCESYFAGEVLIWRLMFGLNGSSLINSEVFQSFNIFFLLINGLESFPIKITKSPKNIFHGVVFQPNYIKLLHSVDMYSTNSMNCKRKDMYVYSSRCFMSFILLHSVSYLGSYHPSFYSWLSWFYFELWHFVVEIDEVSNGLYVHCPLH